MIPAVVIALAASLASQAAAQTPVPVAKPAEHRMTEREWQELICPDSEGWQREVVTPTGTRADCVSTTHACEIDFSGKWAEALGQTAHYSQQLGLKPCVMLICREGELDCLRARLNLEIGMRVFPERPRVIIFKGD